MDERDAVIAAVDAAFREYSSGELLLKLDELGIPAGKVRDLAEVYNWEQTRSQGLLIDVEHATLGTISLPGPPLRFDDDGAGAGIRAQHGGPPTLDQHGLSIRAWLASPGALSERSDVGIQQ